jgi:ketosteroid isomerase-like protein
MQMRKMSIITAGFLLTALAMPAAAQQLSEQEARAAVQNTIDIWVNAAQKKDAATIASLYTEKSMRVTPDGVLNGRAAIQKNLEEGLKVFSNISINSTRSVCSAMTL